MAGIGLHFKWYDGFFLAMLAFSIMMVLLSWKHYSQCTFPLHLWIVVDYGTIFIFRILMFVDNGFAAMMGLNFGQRQRDAYFLGRVVVLFILYVVLYPFLWAWTITGSIWFIYGFPCLPEKNQKWGFLIWLLVSYAGLSCLALYLAHKWLRRRRAHMERAQLGVPRSRITEFGVLVDMIRLPDWVFENAAQEMRNMEQDATPHHPGLYLSENQSENMVGRAASETERIRMGPSYYRMLRQRHVVEALIQYIPLFSLRAVPTDCSDCLICLEEFHVGDLVRGLPCAHNFHLACIDKWLKLNLRCPRCRCSAVQNLDLYNLPSNPPDPNGSSNVSISHHSQSEPISQSYFARMQNFLMPVRSENSASSNSEPSPVSTPNINNNSDVIVEVVENEDQPSESHGQPSQNHIRIADNGDQMSENHGQPSESHSQLSENDSQRTSVEYLYYVR